ncbi:hypothetical protein AMATHDRAFT_164589, partial [Amanita thiersii Skay4041]
DVVHVDTHPPFSYFVPEDVVHHCLEHGWRVKHDKRFEETPVSSKCGLPFISFLDPYIVITPADIHF